MNDTNKRPTLYGLRDFFYWEINIMCLLTENAQDIPDGDVTAMAIPPHMGNQGVSLFVSIRGILSPLVASPY